MIITAADVEAVFDGMLAGRIARAEADRWAAGMREIDEREELHFNPPEDRERIWKGITYLHGIDLMHSPGVFLDSDEGVRAKQREIFGTNESLLAQTEILDFWFSITHRKRWFDPTPAFDREIASRFGDLYAQAMHGEFAEWEETARPALALVILFDQFPRNMFRDTPEAFASDAQALRLAHLALGRGFDQQVEKDERAFFYLPFMHSEELAEQDRSVALFTALGDEDHLKYAELHREAVARFGRLPNRNVILGRESTPEEALYLKQGGGRF